jgi:membrane-associated phospholipid phosphatase
VSIIILGLLASSATLILLTEAHEEIIEPQTQRIDLALIAASAGAGAHDAALKLWFHRDSPSVTWALAREPTFSFPSGHAMLSLVIYGLLLDLIVRLSHSRLLDITAILVALPLILAIGVSRVYLGVHYPSDILAGYPLGAIWLLAVIVSLEALRGSFLHMCWRRLSVLVALEASVRRSIANWDTNFLLRLPPLCAYTIASICGDLEPRKHSGAPRERRRVGR